PVPPPLHRPRLPYPTLFRSVARLQGHALERRERLAELVAVARVGGGDLQRLLGHADLERAEADEGAVEQPAHGAQPPPVRQAALDRKSTRLNSSHVSISYAV